MSSSSHKSIKFDIQKSPGYESILIGRNNFCFKNTTINQLKAISLKSKTYAKPNTEEIRTQIQPSEQKREMTKITNSQNTKRTYGQSGKQLLPKRWPLSNLNRTNYNINTHTVKRKRNQATENHNRTIAFEPCPQFLKYKTFSWLFGSHDIPLARQ